MRLKEIHIFSFTSQKIRFSFKFLEEKRHTILRKLKEILVLVSKVEFGFSLDTGWYIELNRHHLQCQMSVKCQPAIFPLFSSKIGLKLWQLTPRIKWSKFRAYMYDMIYDDIVNQWTKLDGGILWCFMGDICIDGWSALLGREHTEHTQENHANVRCDQLFIPNIVGINILAPRTVSGSS